MKTIKAVITSALLSLVLVISAQAAQLSEYYNSGSSLGSNPTFTLGTDWTLSLSSSDYYAQYGGGLAGAFYRVFPNDGGNLIFKFVRTNGDQNAYDVTVNLSIYNEGTGVASILWGTDTFGNYSGSGLNDSNILAQSISIPYFFAGTSDLTEVTNIAGGASLNGNTVSFHIDSDQKTAYLVVLGGANSSPYLYGATADFTVVPKPLITEYYNNESNSPAYPMGTNWTLGFSPDMLYSQSAGFNAGTSYRVIYGDGNHLLFKFVRQSGDTKAYNVALNLSGYNQWSGSGNPRMKLLVGGNAYGIYDTPSATNYDGTYHSGDPWVWWKGDSANLTQLASSTAEGGFNWTNLSFTIAADQTNAYVMVLGSANSYGYVYSADAIFMAVTPPILNYTNLGGGQLQFSWNGSGILQSQTNSLGAGLGTNWFDYSGGGSSPVTVPVDMSKGSVFFRVKQ